MCKKLIFAKNALFVNRSNLLFPLFFQEKKSDCLENLLTHILRKVWKIKFLKNV